MTKENEVSNEAETKEVKEVVKDDSNENKKLSNVVVEAKNDVVLEATDAIFENLLKLENMGVLCDTVLNYITSDMKQATFMTDDLELTEKQSERLRNYINNIIIKSRDNYLKNIDENKRINEIVKIIKDKLTVIADEILTNISREVNRLAPLHFFYC